MSNLLYLFLSSQFLSLNTIISDISKELVDTANTTRSACKCMKYGKTLLYTENEDTLRIEEKYLFSDDLKYQANDSLGIEISKVNVPFFDKDNYCYSEKFMLRDGYYLIQVVSSSGFTNQYILGNSITGDTHYYTVAFSEGFEDRIWVRDFINVVRKVSSKRQIKYLELNLNEVAYWNQRRFPVFAK